MSVLIKGMEMPKTCNDCLISCEHSMLYKAIVDRRSPDCPLVAVPPHGRLIDADNVVSVIDDEFTEVTRTFQNPIELFRKSLLCGFAKDVITAAPTIIEAEEGDKHEDQGR